MTRSAQTMPHTGGTKSIARLMNEMVSFFALIVNHMKQVLL